MACASEFDQLNYRSVCTWCVIVLWLTACVGCFINTRKLIYFMCFQLLLKLVLLFYYHSFIQSFKYVSKYRAHQSHTSMADSLPSFHLYSSKTIDLTNVFLILVPISQTFAYCVANYIFLIFTNNVLFLRSI